jgi:hypothetical protein
MHLEGEGRVALARDYDAALMRLVHILEPDIEELRAA